jgi:pimeloyl-ACP methyl ester carboxylesterase
MAIYFKERGQGVPLVLLHGFCETHKIWDELIPELSKTCRVITPDFPGFGQSQLPVEPFSISDIGDELIKWLALNEIINPIIIGHSLGGYVALDMAQKMPESILGLGLFHSTIFADSEEKKSNRNKTIEFVLKNGVRPFVDTFVIALFYQKENEFIPHVREIALSTSVKTLIGYSEAMRDRYSQEHFSKYFNGKFLLVAGEHDAIIPFQISEKISQLVPQSMFCTLKNTGHMGMYEDVGASVKHILDFVNWCTL